MNEWREMSIEDLCIRVTSGGTPSRKRPDFYAQEGIPWVKSQELVEAKVTTTGEHITCAGLNGSSAKLLPAGTILMAMYGANVGQLGWLGMEATVNQAICAMIADPNITDSRFLYYALAGNRERLIRKAHGAAQQNLSQQLIKPFLISVPALDTQHQIGDILRTIDDLIENNERRVEVLEEMARVIYREWFVRFRYPGHSDVPMTDSLLGQIPEGWVLAPVSTVITVNPRIKLDKSVDHPFISMSDLDERNMGCRPSQVRSGGAGAKFEQGDTLFARITPCLQNGKTGLVQTLEEGEVGLGSTEFIVLRGQDVGPAFTYCLAREDNFRNHAIASMSGASGRQRVRNECFDSYSLAVPPRDLADKFETTMKPIFLQAAVLLDGVRSLQALRDALLPKLVTGQIDVSTLDLDALLEEAAA